MKYFGVPAEQRGKRSRRYARRNLTRCIKIVKWFYPTLAFFDERWLREFRQARVRVRDDRGSQPKSSLERVDSELSCPVLAARQLSASGSVLLWEMWATR
jgi:hypothetical protein